MSMWYFNTTSKICINKDNKQRRA